jgi:hypothetical protein
VKARSWLVASFTIAAVVLVIGALPAAAVMIRNPVSCRAFATITDKAGKTISRADHNAVEITVPREGLITWEASVREPAKSYSGEIALDFDVFKFAPGDWTFKGAPQKDLASKGVEKIPSFFKYMPPGKYKVAGFRTGDGVTCDGYATIVIQGSPFTNPTGIGILAATLIALIAFVRSGVARVGR